MLRKLNHVGQLVKDLDQAIALYKDLLGLEPWQLGIVEMRSANDGARIAWLPIGDNFIELIEPTDPNGFLAQALGQKGEGLYHISLLADDFDHEIGKLKAKGCVLMEDTFAFCGAEQRVAFILPDQTKGVLIELVDMTRLPAGLVK